MVVVVWIPAAHPYTTQTPVKSVLPHNVTSSNCPSVFATLTSQSTIRRPALWPSHSLLHCLTFPSRTASGAAPPTSCVALHRNTTSIWPSLPIIRINQICIFLPLILHIVWIRIVWINWKNSIHMSNVPLKNSVCPYFPSLSIPSHIPRPLTPPPISIPQTHQHTPHSQHE